MKNDGFTHFDDNGRAVMVDVSEKEPTVRTAVAGGKITVGPEVYTAIEKGTVKKGDVLSVAASAGIMGAKKTWELIPMCHMIALESCRITFEKSEEENAVYCYCTVRTCGRTGAEMEALTGVSTALLTIYDMCKALNKDMEIGQIYLLDKTGGKSGDVHNVRRHEPAVDIYEG